VTAAAWAAPRATRALDAIVALPGSKSLTNRALVLAALADGRSVVRRPLRSRDTELMAAALRVLGVDVTDEGEDWVVEGMPGSLAPGGSVGSVGTVGSVGSVGTVGSVGSVGTVGSVGSVGTVGSVDSVSAVVDVGNAGTVARFVPPLATLAYGSVLFDGDPRVRERPLGPLLLALRELGADLSGVDGLPLTVHGHGSLRGGSVVLDASQSSQLVSGLLLVAPRTEEGVTIRHDGPRLPSAPHLAMTVDALRAAGALVDNSVPGQWRVAPGPLKPRDGVVEPDLSTAAAYLAAPLVAGGSVTVKDWPLDTRQPGAVLPSLLEQMGAVVTRTASTVTVTAGDGLHGIDADLADAPELTMVLTALAAQADSPSRFRGVAHIRLQETDRLAALATELSRAGGDARETEDGIEVRPARLHRALLSSYDDHRLAMAWAVLGLGVDGITVDDIATTRKTVPDFVGSWTAMLGR